MPGYNAGHIGEAAVGYLHIVLFKQLLQGAGFWEVSVQESQKGLAQVGRDLIIPWRVEPDDVSGPGSPALPGDS